MTETRKKLEREAFEDGIVTSALLLLVEAARTNDAALKARLADLARNRKRILKAAAEQAQTDYDLWTLLEPPSPPVFITRPPGVPDTFPMPPGVLMYGNAPEPYVPWGGIPVSFKDPRRDQS